MANNYLFMLIFSFSLGLILIRLFKNISLRHNILFIKGIPHIGGLGIGILFLIVSFMLLFIFKNSQRIILGILIPSMIMLFFGIIDDKKELTVKQKFMVQIIAVSLLILFGIKTQIVYIGDIANVVITFFWIIGITNAFNHLDVMDGLAAAITVIISLAFFTVSIFTNNLPLAFLSLSLAGITLSFLIYNLPPAKIYLGNSGSHFLGFVLSAIAIVINYASIGKKIALLSPILILGFPIFDTAFVMLMRVKKERPVIAKSDDHLALRFLELGYSKKQTLFYMSFIAVFFAFCGISLSRLPNFINYLIICLMLCVSIIITRKMGEVPIKN